MYEAIPTQDQIRLGQRIPDYVGMDESGRTIAELLRQP
jgi:hypothetical protein